MSPVFTESMGWTEGTCSGTFWKRRRKGMGTWWSWSFPAHNLSLMAIVLGKVKDRRGLRQDRTLILGLGGRWGSA